MTSRSDSGGEAKIYDLLLRGKAAAKENGRDIIQPSDLPITKGLQESMHAFRKLDEEIELKSILEYIVALPPLDVTYRDDTEALLPGTFTIIDPRVKNPSMRHWERAFQIFDQLL